MDAAAAALTDEQALTAAALYPLWDGGAQYDAGERVRFDGTLYKCLQPHAAQADWTPTAAPSLWAKDVYKRQAQGGGGMLGDAGASFQQVNNFNVPVQTPDEFAKTCLLYTSRCV